MINNDSKNPDSLFDISGKVILVVGAGGGLGRDVVRSLFARGAKIAAFDLDEISFAEQFDETSDILTGIVDICDEKSVSDMVQMTIDRYCRIDGAINAAGILQIAEAFDLKEEAMRRSLEVNVLGAFLFSRAVANVMRPTGGRIVHIASVSSQVANPGYAAYASSKAALSQMIRVLAREWADQGILINAIGPALIKTDMTQGALADPDFNKQALSVIPLGRFCETADLSGLIILLLAPAGRFITGQTIFVDGGRTLV